MEDQLIIIVRTLQMPANDLQSLSYSLSSAVAFMIENAPHLFTVRIFCYSIFLNVR